MKLKRSSKALTAVLSSVAVASALVMTSGVAQADNHQGGTLVFVTYANQLNHVDPQQVYTGQDIAFLNTYLFRTLVAYKPVAGQHGTDLVPDLATNIGTATDGGRTWSWTIRSGIKWEDGSELTCQDFKYGMSRTFATDIITDGPTYQIQDFNIPTDSSGNSAYAGPYKKTGQDLYDKAVTCSGMTLTVHLNKPVGDFNQYATYPAMSPVKESVDQNSATGGANYDKRPWALGPYKIKEYSVGNQLVMVRNSQWSKASDPIRNAYPDTVQMRFSVAQDTRDQIFLNDSVPNAVNYDQGLQPVNNVAFFKDYKNSSRGMNTGSPYTRYEAFNVSKGHMDCLDVRKAIFFAFPNKAMIDLSGGTRFYGNMTDSPVNPLLATDYAATTGNIHDSNFKLAGNPTYAKQLLAAAKTSCPATYARVTDPNKGFSIDLPNTSTQQKAAALIKPAMAKAGLTVTFNFINSGTYYSTVQNPAKQGDLSRAGWAADWANASTVIPDLFLKDGGFDLTQNWTDPVYADFEKKVIAAQSETNRATQAADWKALSQFVMDQYWLNFPIANREQNQWGSKVGGADFWMPQGSLLFPALYVKA